MPAPPPATRFVKGEAGFLPPSPLILFADIFEVDNGCSARWHQQQSISSYNRSMWLAVVRGRSLSLVTETKLHDADVTRNRKKLFRCAEEVTV